MNADQLKGKWMQFKGQLKQRYGKFTDDAMQQIEGIDATIIGKVQERYGDNKDELMKWEKQWRKQSASAGTKQKPH
ncbi:MAG: CsbD family protein [Nitrospira sp.]|nr:CsbD family protein [Nitrospira sp.]